MEKKNIVVIDAENAVLGRLSSYAAKELLKGKEIAIVNSDKVIVTGNKGDIEKRYEEKRKKLGGILRGPKISRNPDKLLKRTIRGMLPKDSMRGRDALKRVRCYIGIPNEFKDEKMIKSGKSKGTKLVKLRDVYRK